MHHDAPDAAARSVEAFCAQDVPVAVTVVDNASSPAALSTLRERAPGAAVIETGANLGFGPGANVGLRAWLADGPPGEWVAIAPHDALPQPGCLAALVAAATAHPAAALVSAEFGPGFDHVPAVDTAIGGYYRPAPRAEGWEDVDYPHGTLFLARRAALVDIGLFDERYFAYCEEVDLGLRARAAGWRVGMVWGAVVRNATLPTQLLADYLEVRNTLLLVRTRFGPGAARVRLALAVAPLVRRAVVDRGRWRTHLALEGRAVLDHWRGRYGPPPDRVLRTVERAG